MGSGKDTVAKYLYDRFEMRLPLGNGGGVIVCRFAERLKRVTSALTQTPYDDQLSRQGKQKVPPGFTDSLGTLQQKVGMALREHIHPDVWIHAALGRWLNVDGVVIIIPDVRFQNEARFLKERHAVLIRLEGDPAHVRANDARDLNHISETDLDQYDEWTEVVQNTGTLEELYEKMDTIFF